MLQTIQMMEVRYLLGVKFQTVQKEDAVGFTTLKPDPSMKLLCTIQDNLREVDHVGQIMVFSITVSFPERFTGMQIAGHSLVGSSFLVAWNIGLGDKDTDRLSVFVGPTVPDEEIKKTWWTQLKTSGDLPSEESEVLQSIVGAALSVKDDSLQRYYVAVAVSKPSYPVRALGMEGFSF